jgi:hypothetical protein
LQSSGVIACLFLDLAYIFNFVKVMEEERATTIGIDLITCWFPNLAYIFAIQVACLLCARRFAFQLEFLLNDLGCKSCQVFKFLFLDAR